MKTEIKALVVLFVISAFAGFLYSGVDLSEGNTEEVVIVNEVATEKIEDTNAPVTKTSSRTRSGSSSNESPAVAIPAAKPVWTPKVVYNPDIGYKPSEGNLNCEAPTHADEEACEEQRLENAIKRCERSGDSYFGICMNGYGYTETGKPLPAQTPTETSNNDEDDSEETTSGRCGHLETGSEEHGRCMTRI